MRTIVVTSLKPTADLGHQLRCVLAWQDLGLTVRSANSLRDCDLLAEAGVPAHVSLAIPPRETSLDQHQAPTPRIVPLLRRIAADFPKQHLLLTAPGVYPALRNTDCLDHWQDIAPALAMTTEQTPLLETYHFSDHAPCHNQVGAFLLHPGHILRLAEALERWPVAEEMCLGDAGWDLLLAAVITSTEISGEILDSAVLLREAQGNTGIDRSGLTPYVPALRRLGLADAPDPLGAAEDAMAAITASATRNASQTAQIKAFYFATPTPLEPASGPATTIARELLALVPWIGWNYDIAVLRTLAQRILDGGPFDFARIMAVLHTGPSQGHRISETLLAMLIWCRCHPEAAATLRPGYTDTPALAQSHKQSLHQLQNSVDEADITALQLALVTKTAQDMIDHGVWSNTLHDALALSCQNDSDRMLFDTLMDATRKVANAA